jgi:hypothetical protein
MNLKESDYDSMTLLEAGITIYPIAIGQKRSSILSRINPQGVDGYRD